MAKLDFHDLQSKRQAWAAASGVGSNIEDLVDLLQEEMGEMANARVKLREGIRRGATDREALLEAERDAVGDLVIVLAGYCTARNFSLQECVEKAWEEVRQRDWIKFPYDGRTR